MPDSSKGSWVQTITITLWKADSCRPWTPYQQWCTTWLHPSVGRQDGSRMWPIVTTRQALLGALNLDTLCKQQPNQCHLWRNNIAIEEPMSIFYTSQMATTSRIIKVFVGDLIDNDTCLPDIEIDQSDSGNITAEQGSFVECTEEGPVAYIDTWYVHHQRQRRCRNARPFRLQGDPATWKDDILDLWTDVLDPTSSWSPRSWALCVPTPGWVDSANQILSGWWCLGSVHLASGQTCSQAEVGRQWAVVQVANSPVGLQSVPGIRAGYGHENSSMSCSFDNKICIGGGHVACNEMVCSGGHCHNHPSSETYSALRHDGVCAGLPDSGAVRQATTYCWTHHNPCIRPPWGQHWTYCLFIARHDDST